jgi:hypothetical protein
MPQKDVPAGIIIQKALSVGSSRGETTPGTFRATIYETSRLDVHFVNPSPVFCLDKAGDCRPPQTRNISVLPDASQGLLLCQYLMLPQ